MFKFFCSLFVLVMFAAVDTVLAQKEEKTPRKEILTVQGARNINLPPPAPLIYKAPEKSVLKDFVAEDKTFQATFPDVPAVTKQNLENGVVTSYRTYRQGSFSIVNTIDLLVDAESNSEGIYENVKNTFLQTPKTSVLAEREFQIDGKTGKEFDVLQDIVYLKVRILAVGARVYEIRNTVTNWHIIGDATKKQFFAETERFFGSFKPLKTPEKIVLPAPEGFLGEVKGSTYRNTFFNFSFDFPKDWKRLDDAEMNLAKNIGIDALRTDKEKVNRAFADAAQKETVIIGVSQTAFGTEQNASFLVGVLKQPSSRITSEMIGTATKKFFLTNPRLKLTEDLKTIKLGGTEFSTFTIESDFGTAKVNQKILLTTAKGYSISIVLSYGSADDLKQLENILGSVRFGTK